MAFLIVWLCFATIGWKIDRRQSKFVGPQPNSFRTRAAAGLLVMMAVAFVAAVILVGVVGEFFLAVLTVAAVGCGCALIVHRHPGCYPATVQRAVRVKELG